MTFSIKCSKKHDKKKDLKSAASSRSSSRSKSSAQTPKKPKYAGVLPTQLRAIMEAEKMAKNQKGYDNFDIDVEDLEKSEKKK
ncbi:unnamed protein product [Cylicocyclus nassatus]|uniref:Uncharacterized protein n=1 Tax=Cylicocyclus nassatus TaxID=53992 RepID=A0AA36M318_CYLNA|nr:unnamed protein product [Cylicocyclus nassatus]